MSLAIENIWPLLLALITLVSWLIRLESAVKSVEKDELKLEHEIEDIRVKHEIKIDNLRVASETKMDFLASSLSDLRVILARIEGRLSPTKVNKNDGD